MLLNLIRDQPNRLVLQGFMGHCVSGWQAVGCCGCRQTHIVLWHSVRRAVGDLLDQLARSSPEHLSAPQMPQGHDAWGAEPQSPEPVLQLPTGAMSQLSGSPSGRFAHHGYSQLPSHDCVADLRNTPKTLERPCDIVHALVYQVRYLCYSQRELRARWAGGHRTGKLFLLQSQSPGPGGAWPHSCERSAMSLATPDDPQLGAQAQDSTVGGFSRPTIPRISGSMQSLYRCRTHSSPGGQASAVVCPPFCKLVKTSGCCHAH